MRTLNGVCVGEKPAKRRICLGGGLPSSASSSSSPSHPSSPPHHTTTASAAATARIEEQTRAKSKVKDQAARLPVLLALHTPHALPHASHLQPTHTSNMSRRLLKYGAEAFKPHFVDGRWQRPLISKRVVRVYFPCFPPVFPPSSLTATLPPSFLPAYPFLSIPPSDDGDDVSISMRILSTPPLLSLHPTLPFSLHPPCVCARFFIFF